MYKHLFRTVLGAVGILVMLSLGVVNAQETCGSGYVLNAAGTGCELIQVTFDANGGIFSGGEDTKTVDTIVTEWPPVRYSHTANINDDGVASSVHANNLSTNDVVTITGATSLDIEVRFTTRGASYSWLAIYPAGITPTAYNYSSATISNGKLGGNGNYESYTKPSNSDTIYHRRFTATGDTAQFYFQSSNTSAYYGYYAIIKGIGVPTVDHGCAYADFPNPEREGYLFEGWYTDVEFTQKIDLSQCFLENATVYAKRKEIDHQKDIVLKATATTKNQTLTINKYFANDYMVDWGDGIIENLIITGTKHTYTGAGVYTITLSLLGADRWTFQDDYNYPLVPTNGTTMTGVRIVSMPSLAEGFGNSATAPGSYFFSYFNGKGKITSLPEGSFDTNNITTVGYEFFRDFNNGGALTSLPEGSFDTSNITTVGYYFFSYFNAGGKVTSLPEGSFNTSNISGNAEGYFFFHFNDGGALTSLPEGSFNTSKITSVGYGAFSYFNAGGKLTSLPEGSFNTSNISGNVPMQFFSSFNSNGALMSLPEGSFNTSKITSVGSNFFNGFNSSGKLMGLPEGSFDTSKITSAGEYFFSSFNYNGALMSLPEGSFDTSKITSAGEYFFSSFNSNGALTSLPEGSFNTSNITRVGYYFFSSFNQNGKLTSLPEGSFNTSNISGYALNYFFSSFNYNGALMSLPEGSFDTSNITTVGYGFFNGFNSNGALTSLPEGSFNTSNISGNVSKLFFSSFNYNGALMSLPEGSFDTSNITTVGENFFSSFNSNGALMSLPEGSFDTSKITSAGIYSFSSFNSNGALTSLPEGSFNTSKITSAGSNFFNGFNSNGALTSLPEGSFDMSNITTAGSYSFYCFNKNGAITNLPDSFKFIPVEASRAYAYAFDSTGYTLNKKASDLVTGVSILNEARTTFSDNQPGRCGVHRNRLFSTADACHIRYDANGWTGTTTGGYAANVTGVTVGSGITIPIREGYFIEGWYTAAESGERIDTVLFPDMDDKTLYIHWGECTEGYTTSHSGTSCVLKKYNVIHNLKGGYFEDDDGNRHEGNQIMTYTYDLAEDTYHNLNPRTIKRENSKFIGWYMQGGEEFNPGNIPAENSMVYAKYECDLGYIENEEGTACEKIRVELDANGGKFNNGENKNVVNPVIKEGKKDEIRYSHTANINDDGVADSEYENNLSTNDIVTITGATSLDIEVRFATESASYDWLAIYPAGITPTTSNYSSASISNGKLAGHGSYYGYTKPSDTDTTYHRNFTVDGDTVQFYFKSDSSSAYYGYYAIISGKALSEEVAYEDGVFDNIPNPTRNGYKFLGWYYDDQGIEKEFNFEYVTTDRIYKTYAKREKLNSSGGGGGGGGGGGSSSSNTGSATSQTGSQIDSNTGSTASGTNEKEPEGTGDNAEIQTGNQVDSQPDEETSEQLPQNVDKDIQDSSDNTSEGQQYSEEFQQAYEFAKGRGITTMPTIQKANMNGPLTRIAMAKMLSQYAINVLGQKAENTVVPKFNDVTDKQNSDYDNGVTLAYQLGIMGQNMPNNNFRPTDEVTRAEFATALSRMLYNTSDGEYKSTSKYYTHHMEKLKEEGIITKDDPAMKELRGYVMIMLMRSAK